MDNAVALIRYFPNGRSVAKALDLCDGLQGVPTHTRILIKPNLVFWDDDLPFPPYGVITTTRMVEELVDCLAERGYQDITIGESTLHFPKTKVSAKTAYHRLGYHRLVQHHGVKLIDFFDEPFVPVEHGGIKMGITRSALETEFLITLPALKTHSQTRVSLGLKNLKGALDMKTRQLFHSAEVDLDHCIAVLAQCLKPRLNVVDGIYGLEQGPHFFGRAHRLDTILVSTNPLAADIAACHLIGIDPEKVGYLKELAQGRQFPMGSESLIYLGDSPDDSKKTLQWDWAWLEDGSGPREFKEMGITGVGIPKYDNTFCTGCSFYINPLLVMLASQWRRGRKLKGFEFLTGKVMQSQGSYDKTFLLGNCMIRANRSNPKIRLAIPIGGCPPTLEALEKALRQNGVEVDLGDYVRFRKHLMERYQSKPQFDPEDFFPMNR